MYLNPLSTSVRFDDETADRLAETWWLALLGGGISVVFGAIVLAVEWSISSLAVFVGVLFILRGIATAAARTLDDGSRTSTMVLGILEMAAGVAMIVWPEIGLYTLAVFIGVRLLVGGAFQIVGSIVSRHVPHWWLVLIAGLLQTTLGVWALRRPGMTLAVLITLIGVWSIVTGIVECVVAFELRKLRTKGTAPELAPKAGLAS
jgi:uncharacterized membrane protein HdeD (DUF308 family)